MYSVPSFGGHIAISRDVTRYPILVTLRTGSSTLLVLEVFGHIVFRFTRGVTEHYNPEESEFTAESFGTIL